MSSKQKKLVSFSQNKAPSTSRSENPTKSSQASNDGKNATEIIRNEDCFRYSRVETSQETPNSSASNSTSFSFVRDPGQREPIWKRDKSTKKPRKKTKKAASLEYFETNLDGKRQSCKSFSNSVDLKLHLAHCHGEYDWIGDVVISSSVVVDKPQLSGSLHRVEYDLNWVLIKGLISAALPPSTLQQKWLTNLNASLEPWPPHKYREVLKEVLRSMRDDVRGMLERVTSKVALTLEFWTSYEQLVYMGVTCQWIDENWCFQRILLDICQVVYPYGGSEIYSCLVKVLKMYDIEDKVLSCTFDNSKNAIKGDLDAQKVCYIPCAARMLNSIIEDGLRLTKPLIARIREFVLELNTCSEISGKFLQSTAGFGEGDWEIPIDDSIRWSGNYQMLDIVCKIYYVINKADNVYSSLKLIQAPNSMEAVLGSVMLSAAEMERIRDLHKTLEPFYRLTNEICTTKTPTMGLLLFLMEHVSELIDNCQTLDWLKSDAEEMKKKFAEFNSQVCDGYIYMSSILDPRIKRHRIPENLYSEEYLEEAKAHFLKSYYTNKAGSVSFLEELDRKKRTANMSNAIDELTQYLADTPAGFGTDVFEWWRTWKGTFPCLSLMARDFLAIQPTSVIAEEVFSGKGMEVERQRIQMPHDIAQAILCIKSWTERVGLRLKYKSAEVDDDMLME